MERTLLQSVFQSTVESRESRPEDGGVLRTPLGDGGTRDTDVVGMVATGPKVEKERSE